MFVLLSQENSEPLCEMYSENNNVHTLVFDPEKGYWQVKLKDNWYEYNLVKQDCISKNISARYWN